jgi:hypothetical protein
VELYVSAAAYLAPVRMPQIHALRTEAGRPYARRFTRRLFWTIASSFICHLALPSIAPREDSSPLER